MENIFVEFLPPWVETGLQPAFYDKESGTVLQQTARMYARVNMLIRMFNKLSKQTKETVEDYIAKFNELYNYVHDYFDNLDVQEEINNKLDAMVEDGTLQEIITTYIQSNVAWTFDSVANMKLATNFVDGSYAQTFGFYSYGDKGGALYKIREIGQNETPDEMTVIALADPTLVAELIKQPTMNVKQFGAKGDSNTDDTVAIQTAMDNCSTILVPTGTYMIDAVTHLEPNSGNKIILDNDAVIKAITNDATHYAIIWCEDVTNVEICGGTLQGERDTHTGSSGEYGHCIRLFGDCDAIYIHDINLINAWGDGIACVVTGSVRTARVHVDNVRRNGYSIACADEFISTDDIIENVNGTPPQSGVDIEPDTNSQFINNAIFNNLLTKNNTSNGFGIHCVRDNVLPFHIVLNNYTNIGGNRGLWLSTGADHKGDIIVKDAHIEGTASNGILIRTHGKKFAHKLIRPYISNYTAPSAASAGFAIQGDSTEGTESGNIYVLEPIVINPITTAELTKAIGFESADKFVNIKIIDPLDLGGLGVGFNNNSENAIITDKYGVTKKDYDGNYTIGSTANFLNTSDSYTGNHTISISSTAKFPVGTTLKFLNTGDYTMGVKFTSQYIYPLSNTTGSTVTLGTKGSSLEIRRIASDAWMVVGQTGTVSV